MKLTRDQSGQTMVFGAISLFLLVTVTAMIFNVGQVVTHRTEMQNAADAAARTGAVTEANFVSTIAFLNDGMAYIYYNLMRYATNVTVFGVLAELKETGPPYPSDAVVGVANPVAQYNQAFLDASQWVPRCYTWLNSINRVERAIALSGAELVKREIRRTAVENAIHTTASGASKGVEALALFPDFTLLPHSGGYLRLDITQLEPNNGWNIISNTGYMIEVRRLADDHWMITGSGGVQIEVQRIGINHFILTMPQQTLDVERPSDDHVIAKISGPNPAYIDCRLLPGLGWAINAITKDVQIQYEPFRDGGFRITSVPGGSVGVRRGQSGKLESWNGAAWVPIPGDRDEITVGGKTIPVQRSNRVALPGGASLDLPGTIRVGPITYHIPDSVRVGGTGIQLRRDSVRISARVGPATFVIDDMGGQPSLVVNGLTTRHADGRWRILNQRGNRHRMEWPDPARHFWIYEWVSSASYLRDDSIQRLARHAIYDNDPAVLAGQPAAWTEWFNPTTGRLVRRDAYHQSRPSWDPKLTNYVDLDGLPFVRRFARDMYRRNNRQYISVNINAVPRPLRLTDDFLKFGINVAVWRDKDTPMLEGSQKGILRFNMFQNPAWGYFAVASARCAFLDNTQYPPYWRTTFDTSAEIDSWVSRSYQNLYEPVWTGMLVSTRESVKSEHIDSIPPDTGTNFVWRGLAGGRYSFVGWTRGGATWHDPDPPEEFIQFRRARNDVAGKFRSMTDRQGAVFNFISPDLPEVIDH